MLMYEMTHETTHFHGNNWIITLTSARLNANPPIGTSLKQVATAVLLKRAYATEVCCCLKNENC